MRKKVTPFALRLTSSASSVARISTTGTRMIVYSNVFQNA